MRSQKLAIFVVNYNGMSVLGKLFIECISSYIAEAERCGCADVWLVDNGSRDGSLEVIKKKFRDRLGYITYGANLGYGGACNLAYWYLEREGLHYDYYVCANNDIVLFERSLCKLAQYLHTLKQVFPCGFIGAPILVNGYSEGLDGTYYVDTSGGTRSLSLIMKRPKLLLKLMKGLPLPVSYADGAFMILHRAALKKLGKPFEERLFLYGEDVDACLRAWSMGIPSLLLPIILGKHYRGATTERVRGLQIYTTIRNRLYIALKYLGLKGFIYSLVSYLLYPFRQVDITHFEQYSIRIPRLVAIKTINLQQLKELSYISRMITRALIDVRTLEADRNISISKRKHAQKHSLPIISLQLRTLFSSKKLIVALQRTFYKLFKTHMESIIV